MSDYDYKLAVLLQRQFEQEANVEGPSPTRTYTDSRQKKPPPRTDKCLTDPSWELLDPTPNIHNLFVSFNERFFWNKLLPVYVEWSKRMTQCAGICYYKGGMCRIALSEPLLKLRPRKDLVETLLHEMIHAYLFVTRNFRDRDGHGPEFHKHMDRINIEAGTNITVYHSFHDEVQLYKQHWWRCDGPCQYRPPFFGMLQRCTNRAPGPNDFWWDKHSVSCGGKFIKVKEPESKPNKSKSKKKTPETANYPRIDSYFSPEVTAKKPEAVGNVSGLHGPISINKTSPVPSTFRNNARDSNIRDFKQIQKGGTSNAVKNSSSTIVLNKKPPRTVVSVDQFKKPLEVFCGKGNTLQTVNKGGDTQDDYSTVRNHWLNKFPASDSGDNQNTKRPNTLLEGGADKKSKTDGNGQVVCPVCGCEVANADINSHLDRCLNETEESEKRCAVCFARVDEAGYSEHVENCVRENIHDEVERTVTRKTENDTVKCLVCGKNVAKSDLDRHLEDCVDTSIFDSESVEKEEHFCCPFCMKLLPLNGITDHIDKCLKQEIVKEEEELDDNTFC